MVIRAFSSILMSIFFTCSSVPVTLLANNFDVTKIINQSQTQKSVANVDINGEITNGMKCYRDSNSKLMLPLKLIVKKIDKNAAVNLKNINVTVKVNKDNIRFPIGSKDVNINNRHINLSVKPVIKEGKVFVPLQFFSDALGKLVDFDSKKNSVKIYDVKENTEKYFNKGLSSTKYRNISQKLDRYLNLSKKADNFHGSVLIAKGDNILLDKGYNMANFEQNIKNTSKTTFPIGSMTKQFTAMGIMQLVEKGMINEKDKLSKYIPDFPNGDNITIYNLLTHTSGLVIVNELPEFLKMKPKDLRNINNVIDLFKDKPLNFKPGTKFEYCNSGYLLLGYIIEKVSNTSYENYLKTNIFEPLNMNNTGVSYKGNKKMYSSQGYSGYLDNLPIDDELILDGIYGAGSLYSTTEDMYKWSRALNTEKLVSKKTKEKIFSKHVKMSPYSPVSYGYGWMINDGKYGHEIFHGGNVLGFTSNIKRYTDKDLTIIILTNAGYYDVDSITNILGDICFGSEYKLPREKKEIKVPSKTLDKYTGKYFINNVGEFNIIREGNHLYYQAKGQPKFEVFPESNNKVFFKIINAEITFIRDSNGNVNAIELYQFGQKFKGKKVK